MKMKWLVLGLALLAGHRSKLQAQTSHEELLTRIQELEQRVRILSRQQELDQEAGAEKAKTAAVVSAGASGFQIRSADTNFVLKLRGYLQADARFYPNDGDAARDKLNDTFLLRRVRPILEGTVFEKFDYRLMLDFPSAGNSFNNANTPYVQDAYVNARWSPYFQLQAGKFKEPVGLERLQSGANLLFAERSYPTQLLPNRDVGVQLHGEVGSGLVNYAVGVFNGTGDGNASSVDIERGDDEKDVAARIFVTPFQTFGFEPLQGLGLGIAGTYGNHAGTLGNFASAGQQTIFTYAPATVVGPGATTPAVAADGTHWRLSPQGYWYWRSFGLLAEYAISSPEVSRTGNAPATARLEHHGWQVAASWFLTGEDNSFKAVAPRKPFTLEGEGWGAWEAAVRVSELRIDKDAFPTFANPNNSVAKAFSMGAGINWHLNRNFKLTLNYEHTDFTGGAAGGRDQADEHVIISRAQISF